jgi:protoporphyrinogen oxidase
VRIIYIVLDKDYYSDVHWFYLLDPHFRFNRLSEQKNLNKESSPPGKTVISLDISCNYGDKIWNMSDKELFELALKDIGHMGIQKSHILDYFTLKLEDVYPIYNLGFKKSFDKILGILAGCPNVYSTGRQGLFLNNDIHDSLEMGMMASKFILDGKDNKEWHDYVGKYISQRLEGNVK